MGRASVPTLLAIDRYARIMGISPVHFNNGIGNPSFPVNQNTCSDSWPQHSWQFSDHVSREDLARAIHEAEEDLARLVGYYPAPKWICQEVHSWPRHHRRDVWKSGGRNVRGGRNSVRTKFGKFILPGQRTTTLVGTATKAVTLIYDTAAQVLTATITLATTVTDECEIHLYFASQSGAPEWEIRPLRSVTIAGGNVTIVADLWLFIDPDLWELYPTVAGFSAIDITDVDNLVDTVEVYRVFTDTTAASATFFWEPEAHEVGFCSACSGTGCEACALTSQDGCTHVRNSQTGEVVPTPATFNSTTEQWDQNAFTECRDPDQVRIYYLAGDLDNRWLCGDVCDPLSNYWAQTIAYLATARLDRSPCQCGTVQKQFDHLRRDLAEVGERSQQLDPILLGNPLGTRKGEIMAWQRLKTIGRQIKGGAI